MQWEILNVVSDSVVCLNALGKNFNQINALALLMGLMVAWFASIGGFIAARAFPKRSQNYLLSFIKTILLMGFMNQLAYKFTETKTVFS